MNPQKLLKIARKAGVVLYIDPNDGHLHATGTPTKLLLLGDLLQTHRHDLRPLVQRDTPVQHLSSTTRH